MSSSLGHLTISCAASEQCCATLVRISRILRRVGGEGRHTSRMYLNLGRILICSKPCQSIHVTEFLELVDLWVNKILKKPNPLIHSCEQNTDQVARTYERFVYSIVKTTRLYDYQTCQTHFLLFTRCTKVCGFY